MIGTVINSSATFTAVAGAEITGGAFTAVAFSDNAIVQATATLPPFGLLLAEVGNIQKGEYVTMLYKESGLWKTGGKVNAGEALTSDAQGRAVKATAGKFILGFALEEASGADRVIRVQITKSGYAI